MSCKKSMFKKITLFTIFIVSQLIQSAIAAPADDFVITVKTGNSGDSTDLQFNIPTFSGATYNYNVDCNDNGTDEITGATGDYLCQYGSIGIYTIRIKDNTGLNKGFPRIYFNYSGDDDKILTIEQWGANIWTSMERAFSGASNLTIPATDNPNFSVVTSMHKMFASATSANANTSLWDTSSVTTMQDMFNFASSANPDTSLWDTSSVTNMIDMFRTASSANPDTSLWDTSSVISMQSMFLNATSANPNTSLWDTSSVTIMTSMFFGATSANPDTSLWDTSSVISTRSMFYGAISANPDTSLWDTSSVINMQDMFRDAVSANPNTSLWDTSSVRTMRFMFFGATSANPDTSNWDIEHVNLMTSMFSGVTLPTADYDSMLVGFNAQNLQTGVDFGGGNSKYCAIAAHDNLVSAAGHNWNISDGGIDSNCPDPLDDFVITVKTNNPGTSTNLQFNIPTIAGGYNYNVDCDNDGFYEIIGATADYLCNYTNAGTHTIRIRDNTATNNGFPRIYFDNTGDKAKLLTIERWGANKWKSMSGAFRGAINLTIPATDNPDFSLVTSMADMFRGASSANPDTILWDTSSVTSMASMFNNASSANPYTNNWNTSSVTNMSGMFRNATSANPDTSNWNIENITSMVFMFNGVTLPTADYDAMLIGFNAQNVQSGVSFGGGNSKYCAIAAHNNLESAAGHNWNITDGGTNSGICSTDDFVITVKTDNPGFTTDLQFNIPTNSGASYNYNVDCNNDGVNEITGHSGDYVCNYANAGTYTIKIKDNTGTHNGFPRIYFNGSGDNNKILTVEQWGANKWASMERAFSGASNLTIPATDNPDFSLVTSMADMFSGASSVNPDTSLWDTSSVINMASMFEDATSANPDTSNWITSSATNTFNMFNNATSANPNTGSWNTSSVINMFGMFDGATSANPDTSSWNIENVTSMGFMFHGVTLPTADYDAMLVGFNAQNLQTEVSFSGGNSKYCATAAHDNLESLTGHKWTITDGGIDSNCSGPADDFVITVKVTSSSQQFNIPTFSGATYNYNVDCDNNGVYEIIGATGDYLCSYPIDAIYTIRIKDNTGTNNGFPRIYFNSGGDKDKLLTIEQWGTNKWTSMDKAFWGTSALMIPATDNPDFSLVTSMRSMFNNAVSANPNTSMWDTSSVTDMSSMFSGATSANPDTSLWNTSSVISMGGMFQGATSANPDTSLWDISQVSAGMEDMFEGVTLPTADYDTMLIGWFNSQGVQSNIDFHGGNSVYCSAAAVAAHNNLESVLNWSIIDGGIDPNCGTDIIFKNSFEIPITMFSATQKQFVFDFSLLEDMKLDNYPELIAIGVNNEQEQTIKVHIRMLNGQLQIRMSHFYQDGYEGYWGTDEWQDIYNDKMTSISW